MPLFWNWEPLESVGPVRFGQPAQPLIEVYHLRRLEIPSDLADMDTFGLVDWDTYEVPDGETRIYVEGSVLQSVLCCDELFYNGQNLLGITFDEFRQILGDEDCVDAEHNAVYYDRLGLTLWMKNGLVDCATCGGPVDVE